MGGEWIDCERRLFHSLLCKRSLSLLCDCERRLFRSLLCDDLD